MRELLVRMDSQELSWWIAYSKVRPFGNTREDMRMARLCKVMASAWGGKGGPAESDFLFFGERKRAAWQQHAAQCHLFHMAMTARQQKRG
ncbi:MAG: hypothetical protein U0990_09460 [Candidatus Nanopelagicales bacterium]|nr:hypothetical protein [Candidatus Nanopelagicales bacterium]